MEKTTPTQVIETSDGSHSLFSTQFDDSYHSKFGAIRESKFIFLKNGLNRAIIGKQQINILEMGFGTGLNALLTLVEADRIAKKIVYETIEAYPISMEVVNQLNYTQLLDIDPNLLIQLHQSPWEETIQYSPHFSMKKRHDYLEKCTLPSNHFDVIYYDAFAPRAQSNLWEEDIFRKLYKALKPGGIWISYCAKGSVKRNLKAAGFEVKALPGPPGKREITQAIKTK